MPGAINPPTKIVENRVIVEIMDGKKECEKISPAGFEGCNYPKKSMSFIKLSVGR